MQQLGFIQSKADTALHVFQQNNNVIYFIVYVDDILISNNHLDFVSHIIGHIKQCFQIKDLGHLSTFLGIQANKVGNTYFISQEHYVLDILTWSGCKTAKPYQIPQPTNYHLQSAKTSLISIPLNFDNSLELCNT